MKAIISAIFILTICIACKEETSKEKSGSHAEILEIYSAVVDGEAYEKGTLTYKEHKEFRGDQEFGTIYYNTDGSQKGKSIMVYEEDPKHPVGFQYFDNSDSLLVYYQFTYNDNGEQVAQQAFDASNKELLRIERYKFDKKGNKTVKEVRNAMDEVMQRYNFTFDGFGNERGMMVDRGNGAPIDVYTYKIVAYDEDKKWTEKWGFVNDIPKTYHKITKK